MSLTKMRPECFKHPDEFLCYVHRARSNGSNSPEPKQYIDTTMLATSSASA